MQHDRLRCLLPSCCIPDCTRMPAASNRPQAATSVMLGNVCLMPYLDATSSIKLDQHAQGFAFERSTAISRSCRDHRFQLCRILLMCLADHRDRLVTVIRCVLASQLSRSQERDKVGFSATGWPTVCLLHTGPALERVAACNNSGACTARLNPALKYSVALTPEP